MQKFSWNPCSDSWSAERGFACDTERGILASRRIRVPDSVAEMRNIIRSWFPSSKSACDTERPLEEQEHHLSNSCGQEIRMLGFGR